MEVIYRQINTHTIETLLLMSSFALIVLTKSFHEIRFQTFLGLFISDKYLKLYGKEQNLNFNSFNILLFFVQIIVFGFTFTFLLQHFIDTFNLPVYIITLSVALYILFKYYLEKLIATVFNIEFFTENYNFHKVSYRNLIAIVLLPVIAILQFSPIDRSTAVIIMLILFVSLNCIAFILTIKNHQKLIINSLFYFILYLCTLEIAPYLIVLKVISN